MKKSLIFIHVCLIIVLGLAIYNNSLGGDFILDDYPLIKDNNYIRDLSAPHRIFTKNLSDRAFDPHSMYRPMTALTYALDYHFWREDPFGYHLTNVFLHVAASLLVYVFIMLLFGKGLPALGAALIYTALPVHVEAVAYISGRNEILAFIFMILCLIFYLKAIERKKIIFSYGVVVFYIFAVLSKENSFILPVLLCLYHYVFRKRYSILPFFSVWAILASAVILRLTVLRSSLLNVSSLGVLWDKVPQFFAVFLNYLRLLIFPFGLRLGYAHRVFHWNDPAVICGVLAFLFFIWLIMNRRKADPLVSFACGWFIVLLLPVSGLYPLSYAMTELWLYAPSAGFCLVLGHIIFSSRLGRILKIALFAGIMAYYSFLTVKQNEYWREPVSFYQRTLKYRPESRVLYMGLGRAYQDRGNIRHALAAYKKAIKSDPGYVKAYTALASLYQTLGLIPEASAYYEKALEVDPTYEDIYSNLGILYSEAGETGKALELFKRAIALKPNFAKAYYNLGNVYFDLNMFKEALECFHKAVKLQPGYALAVNNLAITYYNLGDLEQAERFFQRSSQLGFVNQELADALTSALSQSL
ncbi:MAG TPA: hypothetical protein DCL35_02085 [Candidatus Omnitrophica bacterium]|nr:hypothetical protein [Candidatus Omnitrophota bacterium]